MPVPPADLTPYDRYGSRLVAAKVDVLRLIRALDRAGVDLDGARPALKKALVRLAKHDALLTSTLALLDAQGRETTEPPSTTFEQLVAGGARRRDDVVGSLAPSDAAAVRRALPIVEVEESEVLAEVEAWRRTQPAPAPRAPARGGYLPTRNGPCPCGSGQKYKKCCLAQDEAREAAAAPPAPPPASAPAMHALDNRLIHRILEFARVRYPNVVPAEVAALERRGGPGHAEHLVGPWVAYHLLVDGAPLAVHYVRHEGERLRPDERAWLEANTRTPLSIWSIEAVVPGASIGVRDLLTGEVRTAIERSASTIARRGDGVCARIVDHGGLTLIVGMHGRPLPPVEAARVAEALRAGLPGSRRRGPDAPVPAEALAGEHARTVLFAWCDAVAALDARPLPAMQNTDGDPLVWTVDRYRFAVEDRTEVLKAIAAIAGVDPAERGDDDPAGRTSFRRAVPGSKALGPEGWTSHGMVHVDRDAATAECNSTKRADRLKAELLAACGRRLQFVRREQQSIRDMMAKVREEGPPPPRPSSPEIDAVIRATKERTYARWIDEKIPALDGATPRQASTDPRLRRRLEALVLSIEQLETRQPAGQRFDVGRIRRDLGWDAPGP